MMARTERRIGGRPARPGRWAALLGAVAVLLLTAGCIGRPLAVPAPAGQPLLGAPPDMLIVIPSGTASAEMRGEPSFKIPDELTVVTGQSIVIRNEDHAMHYFAELPIAPGQTLRKVFGQQGAFGYGGVFSCSIAERKSVTVRVVDRLPD